MAELEVAKATKKIVSTAKSHEHGIWHKVKEMATEIAIIVFAVTLSIALHSWSEDRHEQHEVKVFLNGLRKDLKKDIQEMKSDIDAYKNQKKAFGYFASLQSGQPASQDSIKIYSDYLFSFTGVGHNAGRYEGFKSSGKIGFIENDSLQNSILDLYEERIPIVRISTDFYKTQKLKFAEYVTEQTVGYPDGNFTKIIASEPVKNRSRIYLASVDHILKNYQASIQLMEKIITSIDEEIPEGKKH